MNWIMKRTIKNIKTGLLLICAGVLHSIRTVIDPRVNDTFSGCLYSTLAILVRPSLRDGYCPDPHYISTIVGISVRETYELFYYRKSYRSRRSIQFDRSGKAIKLGFRYLLGKG